MNKAIGMLVVAICAGLLISMPMTAEGAHGERIPQCAEDEYYLRGVGDFSHGRWTRYECTHLDYSEPLHRDVVKNVCENPRHWRRHHGLETAVSEACDVR